MPLKTKTKLPRCCGCNSSIRTASEAKLHPLLKVLICKTCLEAYGTGDFSKFADGVDENGDDNFCRVCVDGGDLFCCDGTDERCRFTFCRECIKRIHPEDAILKRDEDKPGGEEAEKWTCLVCDPSKAEKARLESQLIIERLRRIAAKKNADADHNYANANKKRKSDDPKDPLKTKSNENAKSDKQTNGVQQHPKKLDNNDKKEKVRNGDTTESDRKRMMERLNLKAAKQKPKPSKPIEVNMQRDLEATSMPPLEIPKQAKTSLRNLGNSRVSFSQPMATSTPIRGDRPDEPVEPVINRTPLVTPQSILRTRPQKRVSVGRESLTTSILFAEKELRDRIKEFTVMKDYHLKKVDAQFADIAQHFFTLDPKEGSDLMREHIGSMRRSITEINNMFVNMETLWAARERE